MQTEMLQKPIRATGARTGMVIYIAVDLILWATVGFVAISLLSTSSTAGWSSTVALLAVTVVAILATIAVALSFFRNVRL
jgi:TRAP-type C4-dicarboxylate transport system permease small subunit